MNTGSLIGSVRVQKMMPQSADLRNKAPLSPFYALHSLFLLTQESHRTTNPLPLWWVAEIRTHSPQKQL